MENFLADLNPVIGSGQKGGRPVLIISDEDYSLLMPLVDNTSNNIFKDRKKNLPK